MLDAMFTGNALFFSVAGVAGTVFFVMRMGLMMLGGIADVDGLDTDIDVDMDVGVDAVDSTDAFKLLSFQSIAAFLMGFGWAGFAAMKSFEWNLGPCLLAGLAGGALMMWVLGILMKAVYDLQSSGNISIHSADGQEGAVYFTIPERGTGRGQVRVVINGRQRLFNAVSEGEAIPSRTRVRVTRVNDDNTLTVAPA